MKEVSKILVYHWINNYDKASYQNIWLLRGCSASLYLVPIKNYFKKSTIIHTIFFTFLESCILPRNIVSNLLSVLSCFIIIYLIFQNLTIFVITALRNFFSSFINRFNKIYMCVFFSNFYLLKIETVYISHGLILLRFSL